MSLPNEWEKPSSINNCMDGFPPLPDGQGQTEHGGTRIEFDDPDEHVSALKHPKTWWKANFLSWRFYVTIYAGLALLCLTVNCVALIAAAGVHGVDSDGHILLFDGNCSRARTSSLFGHWLISGISAYLLAASAYVMYCLTPPTRVEVDKAHAKGTWLDIGVMSLRNMLYIGRKRTLLTIATGLTSPVLQLLYNAVLFQTYPANEYTVVVAQHSFISRAPVIGQAGQTITKAPSVANSYDPLLDRLQREAMAGQLQVLSNEECIKNYGISLQTNRRDLVLITRDGNHAAVDVADVFDAPIPSRHTGKTEQYEWMCDQQELVAKQCPAHIRDLQKHAEDWTLPGGSHVAFCLSEQTTEHCKLSFSVRIGGLVTATILIKCILMLAVVFCVHESPIITTGDAISSFLALPDRYTRNMCLASKKLFRMHAVDWPTEPVQYSDRRKRWCASMEGSVITILLLMLLAIYAAAALFSLTDQPLSLREMLALGFGRIDARFFLGSLQNPGPRSGSSDTNLLRCIVLANMPHVIFGILYVLYSNVFYGLSFAAEWASYACSAVYSSAASRTRAGGGREDKHNEKAARGKGLRVSGTPRGEQRSVYFFLIPHRLAWPIMACSVAIHGLIGQSMFLVNVEAYGRAGPDMLGFSRQPHRDFSAVGFSPLGNVGIIISGLVMMGFLIAMAVRRLGSGMPVASTCSAAIAAACHPAEGEPPNAHLSRLRWGVTGAVDGAGHCSFSSKEVTAPIEGKLYR